MAGVFAGSIVPRVSAWVSGLNFQPWPEILKRAVCDVVCMQIQPSEHEGGGREEGQFPSGGSRNFGNRGYRGRMCACTCILRYTYAYTQTRVKAHEYGQTKWCIDYVY